MGWISYQQIEENLASNDAKKEGARVCANDLIDSLYRLFLFIHLLTSFLK